MVNIMGFKNYIESFGFIPILSEYSRSDFWGWQKGYYKVYPIIFSGSKKEMDGLSVYKNHPIEGLQTMQFFIDSIDDIAVLFKMLKP